MSEIEVITAADAASLAPFDAVIDVRSPAEFAEDHVPGAISLPVLSNEERAQVGTIYVQESRFRARRIGAAIIARNVARHLETVLADKGGEFRPLVYCWRGGQRSGAMATILSQVGWRTAVLAGGYKTYRRYVQARLYGEAPPLHPAPVGLVAAGQHRRAPADLAEDGRHRTGALAAAPAVDQRAERPVHVLQRGLQVVRDVAGDDRRADLARREARDLHVERPHLGALLVGEHRQADRAGHMVLGELGGAAHIDDRVERTERLRVDGADDLDV